MNDKRDDLDEFFQIEADRRDEQHAGSPLSRPLNPDYELIGIVGEAEFSHQTGLPLQLKPTDGAGDGGIDFNVPLRYTVDVKCSPTPGHLFVDEGKVIADIYVLAGYRAEDKTAYLIGWEWGRIVKKARAYDKYNKGIIAHTIPREQLRPMTELLSRVMRLV